MPIYEYKCQSCGRVFEALQKISDPPLKSCPKCQGPLNKLISTPAIQFKGSGWYITDYAKKSAPTEGEKSSGNGTAKAAEPEKKAAPPAPKE